jgi:hypothetical protein
MQVIRVELEFGRVLERFHCPLSGQRILYEEDFQPSPAMCGAWADFDISEPMHLTDKIRDAWEQFSANGDDIWDKGIRGFLEELQSDALVAFEITTSGMACGPVSSTVWMVFDMWWTEDEEQGA